MGFEEATPNPGTVYSGCYEWQRCHRTGTDRNRKNRIFRYSAASQSGSELKKTQALILCPTRELAIQVSNELHNLAKYMHGIKILPIYGGQEIGKQIRSLKGGVQIIVGTPGRVMDHLRRKTIRCDFIHTIILDEADEMLNMGFREDIETILSQTPEERQTLLFSATMPQPIMEIARTYQKNAKIVKVVKRN